MKIQHSFWLACVFNLVGATAFANPEGLGAMFGFPAGGTPLYVAMTAYFVGIFGVVYGWMAMQTSVNRPLLYLGALGKGGAFVLAAILTVTGVLSSTLLQAFVGDLLFAAGWLWWLRSTQARSGSV